MKQILPRQLKKWLDDEARPRPVLIDVRPRDEFAMCSIPGSLSLPEEQVPDQFLIFNKEDPLVIICHGFDHSVPVALFFERQGFSDVSVLVGGIDAWALRVDQTMPRY